MTTSTGEQRVGSDQQPRVPEDTFAVRLAIVRVFAGNLTIQEAAARCGIVDQSWSNWERGSKPRDLLDVVNSISDGLGVDRDWLLFGGPLAAPEPGGRRQLKRRRNQDQSGASTLRVSSSERVLRPAGAAAQPATHGPTRAPSRPTAAGSRPSGRHEGASNAPGLRRPAILPRRTIVQGG